VKLSHANASVCEIGAIIGHMWNDLDEAEKKRYNDNYATEKVRHSCPELSHCCQSRKCSVAPC